MPTKNKNKYGRGNVQLVSRENVYVPHFSDKFSYLGLSAYGILAGLIHGGRNQREYILRSIKSRQINYFPLKGFPYFLFRKIYKWLKKDIHISITPEMILDQIFEYFPEIWEYQPKWREVRDTIYVCAQIYYMNPTIEQLDRIIEVRKNR